MKAGDNEFLDTKPVPDDQEDGKAVAVGANLLCQTKANNTNLSPPYTPDPKIIQNSVNDIWLKQACIEIEFEEKVLKHEINYDFNRTGSLEAILDDKKGN